MPYTTQTRAELSRAETEMSTLETAVVQAYIAHQTAIAPAKRNLSFTQGVKQARARAVEDTRGKLLKVSLHSQAHTTGQRWTRPTLRS